MTVKCVVLDANILIRAVLGRRVMDLLVGYEKEIDFCAPWSAFDEALLHLPPVAARRGIAADVLGPTFSALRRLVQAVPEEAVRAQRTEALRRIGRRDPDDRPVVATALTLGAPIWTEDNDFFGTGIPTWTSDRIEIYLKG